MGEGRRRDAEFGRSLDAEADQGQPHQRVVVEGMSGDEVELTDVDYCYEGGRPVLRNLNLRIESGDRIAITGPSGSGKSTLLHILGTLLFVLAAGLSAVTLVAQRDFGALEEMLPFDRVLLALGERADIDGLGTETLGLRCADDGSLAGYSQIHAMIPPLIETCPNDIRPV